ncbi:hypothetical protein JCM11251_002532 [Rhodosporidiobolus azoricus]
MPQRDSSAGPSTLANGRTASNGSLTGAGVVANAAGSGPAGAAGATGQAAQANKRVGLADKNLAMLSLPSQDLPAYYDSPSSASSAYDSTSDTEQPAHLTYAFGSFSDVDNEANDLSSDLRTAAHLPPSSSLTTVPSTNRGHKLSRHAPHTRRGRLGNHAHVDAGFSSSLLPPSSSHALTGAAADDGGNPHLKRRKLNNVAPSSSSSGFPVAPNLHLVPRPVHPLTWRETPAHPTGSYLPPAAQSPLDLLLSPATQHTLGKKNSTFHMLAASTTGLIEQEQELVKELTGVCRGLRGEGWEWRWEGDGERMRQRQKEREERKEKARKRRVQEEEERRKIQEREEEEERVRKEEEEEAARRAEEEEKAHQAATMEVESSLPGPPPPAARSDAPPPLPASGASDSAAAPWTTGPGQDAVKLEQETPVLQPAAAPAGGAPVNHVAVPGVPPSPAATSANATVPAAAAAAVGDVEMVDGAAPSTAATGEASAAPAPASDIPNPAALTPAAALPNGTSELPPLPAGTSATTTGETEPTPDPTAAATTGEVPAIAITPAGTPPSEQPGAEAASAPAVEGAGAVEGEGAGSTAPLPPLVPLAPDGTPAHPSEQQQRHGQQLINGIADLASSTTPAPPAPASVSATLANESGTPVPSPLLPAAAAQPNSAFLASTASPRESEEPSTRRRSGRVATRGAGAAGSSAPGAVGGIAGNGGVRHTRSRQSSPEEGEEDYFSGDDLLLAAEDGGDVAAGGGEAQRRRLAALAGQDLVEEEDLPDYAARLIDPEAFVRGLFVTEGLVELERSPNAGGQGAQGGMESLTVNEQEVVLHDCLTDLHRFLADTLEYRTRLGEIRDGILGVERRRKGMHKVLRTVAMDWLVEEGAGQGAGGGGGGGAGEGYE